MCPANLNYAYDVEEPERRHGEDLVSRNCLVPWAERCFTFQAGTVLNKVTWHDRGDKVCLGVTRPLLDSLTSCLCSWPGGPSGSVGCRPLHL